MHAETEFNNGNWKEFSEKLERDLKGLELSAFDKLKAERVKDFEDGRISKAPKDSDLWEELEDNPYALPDTSYGKPISSSQNIKQCFASLGVKLFADEFSGDTLVRGIPGAHKIDDTILRFLRKALERMKLFLSPSDLVERVAELAVENKINTAIEMFEQCEQEWIDTGMPDPTLLDEHMVRFAKAEDNALTREISANFPVACVLRNYLPGGYHFKYMPIMEGDQDAGKSAYFRTLAGDKYFGDGLVLGADAAKTMEATEGKLIVEAPELAGMSKRDVNELKAFMSRLTDRARRAWARTVTEQPRRFVLVGTTNQDKYLRDETGGVRYCPVVSRATIDDPIDLKGLAEVRRRIWGQAVHRAKALLDRARSGEYVLAFSEEARAVAKSHQSDRYEGDDVFEALRAILCDDTLTDIAGYVFVTPQTLQNVIASQPSISAGAGRMTKAISAAMMQLGWYKKKVRRSGERSTIIAYSNAKLDFATVDETRELQFHRFKDGREGGKLTAKVMFAKASPSTAAA